jgi:hypothetical protein
MNATIETYHVAHGREGALTVTDSATPVLFGIELPAIFDPLPATGYLGSWRLS